MKMNVISRLLFVSLYLFNSINLVFGAIPMPLPAALHEKIQIKDEGKKVIIKALSGKSRGRDQGIVFDREGITNLFTKEFIEWERIKDIHLYEQKFKPFLGKKELKTQIGISSGFFPIAEEMLIEVNDLPISITDFVELFYYFQRGDYNKNIYNGVQYKNFTLHTISFTDNSLAGLTRKYTVVMVKNDDSGEVKFYKKDMTYELPLIFSSEKPLFLTVLNGKICDTRWGFRWELTDDEIISVDDSIKKRWDFRSISFVRFEPENQVLYNFLAGEAGTNYTVTKGPYFSASHYNFVNGLRLIGSALMYECISQELTIHIKGNSLGSHCIFNHLLIDTFDHGHNNSEAKKIIEGIDATAEAIICKSTINDKLAAIIGNKLILVDSCVKNMIIYPKYRCEFNRPPIVIEIYGAESKVEEKITFEGHEGVVYLKDGAQLTSEQVINGKIISDESSTLEKQKILDGTKRFLNSEEQKISKNSKKPLNRNVGHVSNM